MSINIKEQGNITMETLFLNESSKQIAEMKSIQPYSTKDEYIYAMKEDLAEWFNSMYATTLNANNFIEQLKNGVLICEHANNVMREAAFKAFKFHLYDLQQAGIINITNLTVVNPGNAAISKNFNFRSNTPTNMKSNGQSAFAGEYLMYNQEPKMIMIAYDNITNFIKWCRYIVKVKECLMFETEDLTLCKNEKNFILCLLEVARFGSKFGIRVPTIIQLEQEIEAEMENDKNLFKNEDNYPSIKNRFIEDKIPNKEYIKSLGQNDDIETNKSPSPSPSPPPALPATPATFYNRSLELSTINDEILTSSFSSISNSVSMDKLKDMHSPSSSSPSSPNNSSSRSNSPNKFLKESDQKTNSDLFSPSESLSSPVSSLTSLTASLNHMREISDLASDSSQSTDLDKPFVSHLSEYSRLPIKVPVIKTPVINHSQNKIDKINLHSLIPNKIEPKVPKLLTKSRSSSIENLIENKPPISESSTSQQVNLHKHVCSIANKCTCEKKFLVDKIGEGKYRIGNTKNIVFIRILKNHIMVRVGGGWDTLENYLDKHDPCRCSSDLSSLNKRYNETNGHSEHSNNNIILTPVKPTVTSTNTSSSSGGNQSKGVIRVTTINCNNSNNKSSPPTPNSTETIVKSKSNSNINFITKSPQTNNNYHAYESDTKRAVDFTDAHLIIERDNQGKHQIGKILLASSSTTNQPHQQVLDESFNAIINNNNKIKNVHEELEREEEEIMNRNLYFLNALKHATQSDENKTSHLLNNNNSSSTYSSIHFNDNGRPPINSDSIYSSSLISFSNTTNKTESMIRNKMKKLINKIPNSSLSPKQPSVSSSYGLRKSASSTQAEMQPQLPTQQPMMQSTTNSPATYRKVEPATTGLLKFSRTNFVDQMHHHHNTQQQLQTQNSLRVNFDSDNTLDTPVYTETKLPPRILRKYQKERSVTEVALVSPHLNQQVKVYEHEKSDIECSSSSCGSAFGSSITSPKTDIKPNQVLISDTTSTSSYHSNQPSMDNDDDLLLSKKQNSLSPKLTVKSRNKLKKYKKSKTTDVSRYQEEENKPNSNTSSDLVNSDFDSLESDDNQSNDTNKLLLRYVTPSPIQKVEHEHLNDSLELIPTEKDVELINDPLIDSINANKLDDDSLINVSTPKNYENDVINIESLKAKTNRAQWDKSRQQIDLMYFNFSKLNQQQNDKTVFKATKYPVSNKLISTNNMDTNRKDSVIPTYNRSLSQTQTVTNTSTLPASLKNKRVKNLNLAKEKLYEMKKTIDAKVNLDNIAPAPSALKTHSSIPRTINTTLNQTRIMPKTTSTMPVPTTQNTRTTPRKVKKRSGERSLTTGIIMTDNLNKSLSNSKPSLAAMKANSICASNTSISSVCTNMSNNNNSYAKIQTNKMRSRTPNQLTSSSLSKMQKTSASLHNISKPDESFNESQINTNGRNRHDSFSSTASSFFGNASSIGPNDYKENKAYELRKKSTLMNKIITKHQQHDPIYSRSHPICAEIIEQKLDLNNITIGSLGSYEQKHSAARKRLFAKKNEKPGFDPNISIGSNGSSTTSSSTNKFIPITSPIFNTTRQSRAASKCAPNLKKTITPRSKSNNDLYYELERTNSAQDLIELLNNCDAPAGDLNQYKVMLSECEKLQFHINKLKSQHRMKKSCASATPNNVVTGAGAIKKSLSNIHNRKPQDIKSPRRDMQSSPNKKVSAVKSAKYNETKLNQDLENRIESSNLTNSMHRRSHSLPSYIAIPVIEKLKNMQ